VEARAGAREEETNIPLQACVADNALSQIIWLVWRDFMGSAGKTDSYIDCIEAADFYAGGPCSNFKVMHNDKLRLRLSKLQRCIALGSEELLGLPSGNSPQDFPDVPVRDLVAEVVDVITYPPPDAMNATALTASPSASASASASTGGYVPSSKNVGKTKTSKTKNVISNSSSSSSGNNRKPSPSGLALAKRCSTLLPRPSVLSNTLLVARSDVEVILSEVQEALEAEARLESESETTTATAAATATNAATAAAAGLAVGKERGKSSPQSVSKAEDSASESDPALVYLRVAVNEILFDIETRRCDEQQSGDETELEDAGGSGSGSAVALVIDELWSLDLAGWTSRSFAPLHSKVSEEEVLGGGEEEKKLGFTRGRAGSRDRGEGGTSASPNPDPNPDSNLRKALHVHRSQSQSYSTLDMDMLDTADDSEFGLALEELGDVHFGDAGSSSSSCHSLNLPLWARDVDAWVYHLSQEQEAAAAAAAVEAAEAEKVWSGTNRIRTAGNKAHHYSNPKALLGSHGRFHMKRRCANVYRTGLLRWLRQLLSDSDRMAQLQEMLYATVPNQQVAAAGGGGAAGGGAGGLLTAGPPACILELSDQSDSEWHRADDPSRDTSRPESLCDSSATYNRFHERATVSKLAKQRPARLGLPQLLRGNQEYILESRRETDASLRSNSRYLYVQYTNTSRTLNVEYTHI
jgi:hypothetical protein